MKKVLPTIIICGGTGTGKSKLGIELAKKFNGEVINADAIQIYKGLDIASNKVTEEESDGIKHHLLGIIEPSILDYCIHDFKKTALSLISEIKNKEKVPIVVGGTNYYLNSLLWENLVPVEVYDQEWAIDKRQSDHPLNKGSNMTDLELYNWLAKIDPKSASKYHPKDRRKVWRSLEIALFSGLSQSQHLELQDEKRIFKLSDLVLFWLYADADYLEPRLDKRVDEMINRGLLNELDEIQSLFIKYRPNGKFTKGIFQAIGFKEFQPYLELEDRSTLKAEEIKNLCIENLKIAHKRYVKRQNKDICKRFLCPGKDNCSYPVYKLDSSIIEDYSTNVFDKAVSIIEQTMKVEEKYEGDDIELLRNSYEEFVSQLSIKPEKQNEILWKPDQCYRVCEACDNKIFVIEEQWSAHLRGRKHQNRVKALKRKQEYEEFMRKNGDDDGLSTKKISKLD